MISVFGLASLSLNWAVIRTLRYAEIERPMEDDTAGTRQPEESNSDAGCFNSFRRMNIAEIPQPW
jgi:hypothetical protein